MVNALPKSVICSRGHGYGLEPRGFQKPPFVERYRRQPLGQPQRKPSFVLTADLYAKRSECPVSAFHVEMCMVQNLSLKGFLAFTAIGTNVRTSLIPPPA